MRAAAATQLDGCWNESEAEFNTVGDKVCEVEIIAASAIERLQGMMEKFVTFTSLANSGMNAMEGVVE